MGGNAFPHLEKNGHMTRIKREYVEPTVRYVVDRMAMPGFDHTYAFNNLMGSAGKQASSGDLDFAVNNTPAKFVGQAELPVFNLRDFNLRAREFLGDRFVDSKTLKGGQFQTAWPVVTSYDGTNVTFDLHEDGQPFRVQVDFIEGDPEWLKFSHWSPGKDNSPWKGVMVSTMLGVLAKLHKEFELRDEHNSRVARVGLHFDLELGLHRKWEYRKRVGNGMSKVDPDYFETKVPNAPRFSRVGYVTNPDAVLHMLFGKPVLHSEVDTFEKMLVKVRECFPHRYNEVWERFVEAFMGSAGRKEYDLMEVAFADVWGLSF